MLYKQLFVILFVLYLFHNFQNFHTYLCIPVINFLYQWDNKDALYFSKILFTQVYTNKDNSYLILPMWTDKWIVS